MNWTRTGPICVIKFRLREDIWKVMILNMLEIRLFSSPGTVFTTGTPTTSPTSLRSASDASPDRRRTRAHFSFQYPAEGSAEYPGTFRCISIEPLRKVCIKVCIQIKTMNVASMPIRFPETGNLQGIESISNLIGPACSEARDYEKRDTHVA